VTDPRAFSLTDAERLRIERVDHLVLLGAASVDELMAGLSDASWTVRRAVVAGLAVLGDGAVDALCRRLRSDRSSERALAAAIDALSASMSPAASPAVLSLLDDPDPAVVADAAQVLGRRIAVEAVPALVELLEHPDDNVAVAAIEALGAIGDTRAIDALVDALGSGNFFRTFPALRVLTRVNDPRVVAPLARLLDDDTYRIEAARALGGSGHAQAIRPLASLLAHAGDAIVRLVALALADLIARARWHGAADHVAALVRRVIGPFASRFVGALRNADAAERVAIAVVLGRIGAPGVIPDLAHLLDDPEVRPAATDAIQRITRQQDDALIDALSGDDPSTRAAVLPIVGTMRAAEAVHALLGDDDPETRAKACEALARIGDTAAVPRLFAALGDPNPRVGHAASAAIQSLGVPDTAERAIAALRTGAPAVRRHALRIISYMGFAEAFAPVTEAIAEPDPRIAELAVGALGMMVDPRVDPALQALARDPREAVRAATMRAAASRGGAGALRVLEIGLADPASWVRYYACQGLGRTGNDASATLIIGRLSDATPHVRIAAIEALAGVEAPGAWQALKSALRSSDLDEQRAALASIALHTRSEALAYLLEGAHSRDSATRLIALSGLARRREPAAIAAIAVAAADHDPVLRDAALSLLGERGDPLAIAALIELALEADVDHPIHLALSLPGALRVRAIALRLTTADDRAAGILVAALARVGDELATGALFEALASPSAAVRRAAAGALVGIGASGAAAAAAELARADPDPEVRLACTAMSPDLP
jgi:HEAT repeat protein